MPDATITSTASTFGTISGTFAADQSTIVGTVSGIIPGTLTGSVGVPGPAGPAGIGLPAGGASGQFLQKTSGADYATDWVTVNLTGLATESWVTAGFYPLTGNPSGFLTAAALTPYLTSATAASTYQTLAGMSAYLTKADNLGSLTNFSTARDNLGLGSLSSPTFAGLTLQGSGANVGQYTPTSLSLSHTTFGSFVISPSSGITFPDSSVQTTAFTTSQLTAYLAKASNLSDLASTSTARTNLGLGSLAVVNDAPSDGSQYARKNGAWDVVTATSSYITSVSSPLSVTTGNLSIDLSAYAPLASPTFTGDARAVTPAFGDNDTSIATTAFVQSALLGGTAVARNLEVEVRNQSGSTIPAGSIVYISGATGNKPLITLAQANNDANSAQTIGFVKTAIANNGTGYVIVRGELENIDTSALTEGVQLYLSPTTAGTWTTTKPSAPQHMVYVGVVIRSHPSLGTILVAVMNGLELEELHNVAALTPANNDLLAYESSTDLWKNKTYSALGLLTSSAAASTYRALANSTFNSTISSQGLLAEGNPAVYTEYTNVVPDGLLIRNVSSGITVGEFRSNSVLIPSVGITFSDATTQTSAGISAATAASTYYLQTNPAGYITSAAISGLAPLASPSFTGNVSITSNSTGAALFIEQSGTGNILTLHDQASDTTFVAIDQNGKVNTIASTTTNAGFNIPHATAAPATPVNGDVWTTTGGLFYRINGATVSPATLAGGTFTGTIITAASTTTAAGLRIPVGTAPTTPVAGDVWSSSGANGTLNFRSGGGTTQAVAALGLAQTFTGNNTFSGATLNFGNATTATTIGLGNGATATATTKTLNIGTGGVAGSTTTINVGTTGGGSATANVNALLISRASTATEAGLRILPGTAPSAPVNGDTWTDAAGFYARINGATQNLVPPALATLSEARQFTNDTKVMSPRDVLWSMLSQDFIDIDGPSMTVTNTGTITSVQVGQLSRNIRPGNAGACSSRIRTFGVSQVDQTWTATSRAQPSSFLNFSLRSIHSGRSTTSGVTDANYTCAVYYGKAEADGVGDLTRRGYGWKMVGGAGSRFLQLQAHNGTTLSSVTSSFAVTAGVAFDWDIESDGAGNVTLYVNGSSVATSNGGPTGSVNITAVAWQEEVVAAAALSSPFMDFTNSRGRFIVINTW